MIHNILELYFLIFKIKDPEYTNVLDRLIKLNITNINNKMESEYIKEEYGQRVQKSTKTKKNKGLLHFKPNRG